MLVLLVLLLVPLCLRYLASWKMKKMQAALLQGDREVRALLERCESVTAELRQVRRGCRQYEVRRSFLYSDIQEGRRRLERLREAAVTDRRLAA